MPRVTKGLGAIGVISGGLLALLLIVGGAGEMHMALPGGSAMLGWGLLLTGVFALASLAVARDWSVILIAVGALVLLVGFLGMASVGIFLIPAGACLLAYGLSSAWYATPPASGPGRSR